MRIRTVTEPHYTIIRRIIGYYVTSGWWSWVHALESVRDSYAELREELVEISTVIPDTFAKDKTPALGVKAYLEHLNQQLYEKQKVITARSNANLRQISQIVGLELKNQELQMKLDKVTQANQQLSDRVVELTEEPGNVIVTIDRKIDRKLTYFLYPGDTLNINFNTTY